MNTQTSTGYATASRRCVSREQKKYERSRRSGATGCMAWILPERVDKGRRYQRVRIANVPPRQNDSFRKSDVYVNIYLFYPTQNTSKVFFVIRFVTIRCTPDNRFVLVCRISGVFFFLETNFCLI